MLCHGVKRNRVMGDEIIGISAGWSQRNSAPPTRFSFLATVLSHYHHQASAASLWRLCTAAGAYRSCAAIIGRCALIAVVDSAAAAAYNRPARGSTAGRPGVDPLLCCNQMQSDLARADAHANFFKLSDPDCRYQLRIHAALPQCGAKRATCQLTPVSHYKELIKLTAKIFSRFRPTQDVDGGNYHHGITTTTTTTTASHQIPRKRLDGSGKAVEQYLCLIESAGRRWAAKTCNEDIYSDGPVSIRIYSKYILAHCILPACHGAATLV
ncbi:hypothetical protein GGX14DRAFT_394888 [Mycena pura]|uniref:Uncharacterized protein n=1 Tax=Mycena pura TaxID=153505 RepID=A0AAD6YF71_9AGAR|nr:hypothetical protein GGX14DRAFT_394888 [Mycena pura]